MVASEGKNMKYNGRWFGFEILEIVFVPICPLPLPGMSCPCREAIARTV